MECSVASGNSHSGSPQPQNKMTLSYGPCWKHKPIGGVLACQQSVRIPTELNSSVPLQRWKKGAEEGQSHTQQMKIRQAAGEVSLWL